MKMKKKQNILLLFIDSIFLSLMALALIPKDSLMNEIIKTESGGFNVIFFIFLTILYIFILWTSFAVLSFIGNIFVKFAYNNKNKFDIKISKKYTKSVSIMLITIHVFCLALLHISNIYFYIICSAFLMLVLLIKKTKQFIETQSESINILIIIIPYVIYIFINIIYYACSM